MNTVFAKSISSLFSLFVCEPQGGHGREKKLGFEFDNLCMSPCSTTR
jgi:hypothetical protein